MTDLSGQVWGGGFPLQESVSKNTHTLGLFLSGTNIKKTHLPGGYFSHPPEKFGYFQLSGTFHKVSLTSRRSARVGTGSGWAWGDQPTARCLSGPHTHSLTPPLLYLKQERRRRWRKRVAEGQTPPEIGKTAGERVCRRYYRGQQRKWPS